MDQVFKILKTYGISDAFSLNICFTKEKGPVVLHNIEIGPNQDGNTESELNIKTLKHGDVESHCNK